MEISQHLKNEMEFLTHIDPVKSTIVFQNNTLKEKKKSSRFHQFIRWALYILTCGCMARNPELDKASASLLKEMKEIKGPLSPDETALLESGMKTLIAIIKNNGGRNGEKAHALLEKIHNTKKMQKEELNLLEKKELPPEDGRLSEKLAAFKEKKPFDTAQAIRPLLLEIKNPKPLTNEEIETLGKAFPLLNYESINKRSEWVKDHLPKFSPLMIGLITSHAINWEYPNQTYKELLNALTKEPVIKENLSAFLTAIVKLPMDQKSLFRGCLDKTDKNAFMALKENSSPQLFEAALKNILQNALSFEAVTLRRWIEQQGEILSPTLIAWLTEEGFDTENPYGFFKSLYQFLVQDGVSKENLSAFLTHFPKSLTGKNKDPYLSLSYLTEPKNIGQLKAKASREDFLIFANNILLLMLEKEETQNIALFSLRNNTFGDEYRELLYQEIIAIAPKEIFLKIIDDSKSEDRVAKTLLEKRREELIEVLKGIEFSSGRLEKWLPLFEGEDPSLRAILQERLSQEMAVEMIEKLPSSFLKSYSFDKWLSFAKVIVNTIPINENKLKTLANVVKEEDLTALFDEQEQQDLLSKLIPHLKKPLHIKIIDHAIDNLENLGFRVADELEKLPLEYWKEASQKNLTRTYDTSIKRKFFPSICASIANGQVGNHKFLKEFFENYFEDQPKSACLKHLDPGIFSFENPESISLKAYQKFFTSLRDPKREGCLIDDKQRKKLIQASTENLFNAPKFDWLRRNHFFLLDGEQLNALNIDAYQKPEIRFLIAYLNGNENGVDFAIQLIKENPLSFDVVLSFLIPIPHEVRSMKEEDLLTLQSLLIWTLRPNNPEVRNRLKLVWDWLNVYANELLQFDDVKAKYQPIVNGIKAVMQSVGARILPKEYVGEAKKRFDWEHYQIR